MSWADAGPRCRCNRIGRESDDVIGNERGKRGIRQIDQSAVLEAAGQVDRITVQEVLNAGGEFVFQRHTIQSF